MPPQEISRESVSQKEEILPRFSFEAIIDRFAKDDPDLFLHKVSKLLPDGEILQDDSTWVSSSVRGGKITIGMQKNPPEIESLFKWGTTNEQEEMIVKVSHEVSHKFQEVSGIEQALIQFLSGSNTIDQKYIPYLSLYSKLSGANPITGLPTLSAYHTQTQIESERVTSGIALDVRIIEDITELIAAYFLGDAYFNFRLESGNRKLTPEEMKDISELVVKIVHTFI